MTLPEAMAITFSPAAAAHIAAEIATDEETLKRVRVQIESLESQQAELLKRLSLLAHWQSVVEGRAILYRPKKKGQVQG